MKYYDKLTNNRVAFINQLYNLLINQFDYQNSLTEEKEELIEILENNSECIQRIFIDAPWGMGKTYFGKAFGELIDEKNNEISEAKKINLVKINAWEMDYFSDPLKSLMVEILNIISDEEKKEIITLFEKIGKAGIKELIKRIAKILASSLIGKDQTESIIEICNSISSGIGESEDFLKDYKDYKENLLKFKENLSKIGGNKIILIDELDRCRPIYAIELLETIKHIFGVKNIIFILLVNKNQLKSTASLIYCQEDKCSEYFEKFFDIQFILPEIEYDDFIKLEYEKYEKIDTYNVQNGTSQKRDLYLESIFLDMFKSNCERDGAIPAVRLLKKIFNKYKLLLSSLADEEKSCYVSMIFLINYFLEKELSWKKEENILVYLKTFYNIKNQRAEYERVQPNDLEVKYCIKNKYKPNEEFFNILYKILYVKTGLQVTTYGFDERSYSLILKNNFQQSMGIKVKIGDSIFGIAKLDMYLVNGSGTNVVLLGVKEKFFQNIKKEKYVISQSLEKYYSIALLYKWCKEKYNFII